MTYAVVSLVSSVIGGVILAAYQRWRDVPAEVERHDQRAYELNEDLRRFVRDRDVEAKQYTRAREFSVRLEQIIRQHGLGGPASPEARAEAAATAEKILDAHRNALHQYRDEASRAIRELRSMGSSERRLHRLVRRRRQKPPPRLALPEDCLVRLRLWREPVPLSKGVPPRRVGDPSRPELEPDLAALESEGITWDAPPLGTMPPT